MAPAPSPMTVDDYLPRTPETLKPLELAHGVLRVADAPTPRHRSAVTQPFLALDRHVSERQLGKMWIAPLDVVLDEAGALIVQPDLFFVSNDRAFIVRDRVRGAPDLVIEVLSPSPRIGRTLEHLEWFAEHGVRECWLVRQERRPVTVVPFTDHRESARRLFWPTDRIESRVLPELALRLDDILD
jgi:Uma2 family endonuclease